MPTKTKKPKVKVVPKAKRSSKKQDVNINITINGGKGETKNKVAKTKIALVVDRSGSMSGVREQAWSGINEQLNTIKNNRKETDDIDVTYIQFDNVIETVFNKKAQYLEPITREQYQPRNSTALRDAVWTAINQLECGDPEMAYLVVVISDGYENASQLISEKQLAERIDRLQKSGQWTFTYMMSNIDLSKFRNEVNAFVGNSVIFDSTPAGTKKAFTYTANSVSNYMSSRAMRAGQSYSLQSFYDPNVALPVDDILDDVTTKVK